MADILNSYVLLIREKGVGTLQSRCSLSRLMMGMVDLTLTVVIVVVNGTLSSGDLPMVTPKWVFTLLG